MVDSKLERFSPLPATHTHGHRIWFGCPGVASATDVLRAPFSFSPASMRCAAAHVRLRWWRRRRQAVCCRRELPFLLSRLTARPVKRCILFLFAWNMSQIDIRQETLINVAGWVPFMTWTKQSNTRFITITNSISFHNWQKANDTRGLRRSVVLFGSNTKTPNPSLQSCTTQNHTEKLSVNIHIFQLGVYDNTHRSTQHNSYIPTECMTAYMAVNSTILPQRKTVITEMFESIYFSYMLYARLSVQKIVESENFACIQDYYKCM